MIHNLSATSRLPSLRRAAAAACFLVAGGAFWSPPTQAQHIPPTDFSELSAKLLPTVVNVSVRTKSSDGQAPSSHGPGSPFDQFMHEFQNRRNPSEPQSRRGFSVGSGFVIDAEKGYIVTDNHVIEHGDEIMVTFANGKQVKATVVGRDPAPAGIDIAVLKINPIPGLVAAAWGDSDAARVGEWVLAIGNPYNFANTVSTGIISARNRDMGGHYDDFIQTDAAINQGNSGGPLFNMKGEVIGINTLIYSPSGVSIGLGFATSSAEVKPIVAQLIQFGAVRRGWVGVNIQNIDDDIAEGLGMKAAMGALVGSVTPLGPAANAGIKAEDVILAFDGKNIGESRYLPRLVAEAAVDREVPVKLWRDGKEITKTIRIAALPDENQILASAQAPNSTGPKKGEPTGQLGLSLSPITAEMRQQFQLSNDVAGVLVIAVQPDSPAAQKKIIPGDVVIEVNQQEVKSPTDVLQKLDDSRKASRKSVLLLVQGQHGETHLVALPVPGKS